MPYVQYAMLSLKLPWLVKSGMQAYFYWKGRHEFGSRVADG